MMSIPLKGFTNRMGFIYTSLVMGICLYSLSAQLLQSNVEIVGGAVLQHIQTYKHNHYTQSPLGELGNVNISLHHRNVGLL